MAFYANSPDALTITETDEVDNATATYIYSKATTTSSNSSSQKRKRSTGRVDVVHPSPPSSSSLQWSATSLLNYLIDIFLPAGYPHSVSDDYLRYQIFDSLQAFCSSIAGLLSSRAVLQGVGVGNASASPTSALLLHILQDSSGRIATILFAHRVGTALEPECKMYRLAADVFNDVAMVLDCLSPMMPAGAGRISVLSAAGILRALCGVAGGSSKASLSAHFAKWGNLAEVNAKDSSQETIISLVGMLIGSFVVSQVTSFAATWLSLLLLLITHLGLNYAAVRAVHMKSLNRQRANIVFSALLESDADLDINDLQSRTTKPPKTKQQSKQARGLILSPEETARRERIFERDGVLRWISGPSTSITSQKLGYCRIGVSFHYLLRAGSCSSSATTSVKTPISIPRLASLFSSESYILFLTDTHHGLVCKGIIVLKKGCTAQSQIKAWAHALLVARVLSTSPQAQDGNLEEQIDYTLHIIARTLDFLNEDSRFEGYTHALAEAGWDMDVAALETRPGRRISLQ